MSEAPVLTAKQQRKTLSNVKKKKKTLVRNVYGHPRKEYWPVVGSEDESIILNSLRKLLPAYKTDRNQRKADNPVVKNVGSSSSKGQQKLVEKEGFGDPVIFGLQKVLKEIENKNLKCLLLANEIDPPSLGYLIGNLATSHNIPYIALTNLKSCVEELLGFKSMCVGFTVSSNQFDQICDKVKRLVNGLSGIQTQEESSPPEDVAKPSVSKSTSSEKSKNLSDLHLYRTDKSVRVFIPESSNNQDKSESTFLSFSKDISGNAAPLKVVPITTDKKQSKNPGSQKTLQALRYFDKVKLLPLQVKRFQENPNKLKWKKSKNRSLENGQKTT